MHPFIVYGTLRVGGSNADLWCGRATTVGATLPDFELLDTGLDYPIVVPCVGASAVAELLTPVDESTYADLLVEFDELEEVPTMYERIEATVLVEGGRVGGWLYVGVRDAYADLTTIVSGDWFDRSD